MQQKYDLIMKNQTWKLQDLLACKRKITNKWVFKTKLITNGQVEKLKARLVARGFKQTKGINFQKTFSPTIKWATVHKLW